MDIFQSTRPRGARLPLFERHKQQLVISIHAPAWGATSRDIYFDLDLIISIHAPAWGATSGHPSAGESQGISIHAPAWGATRGNMESRCLKAFQSTRPRGARLPLLCRDRPRVGISIHAPAWGATQENAEGIQRVTFQSTRPRGARLSLGTPDAIVDKFQSTRPRGARRLRIPAEKSEARISIHAPAWGATRIQQGNTRRI